MGVAWSVEFLSEIFDYYDTWISHPVDFVNTLQGVWMFFMFVMKKNVKILLIKRWEYVQIIQS